MYVWICDYLMLKLDIAQLDGFGYVRDFIAHQDLTKHDLYLKSSKESP